MGQDPNRDRRCRFVALVAACLGLLGSAAEAASFTPRPVPGRMLLTLAADADARALLRAASAPAKTGDAALDRLNARLQVHDLAPVFPSPWWGVGKAETGVDLSRFFRVEFPASVDLEMARSAYEALPAVARAEFDWMQPLQRETNDPSAQWHLESSSGHDAHVTGGWNHSTGDTSIVLAIADSGVDWMHPDLGGTPPDFTQGNIRINWDEYHGAPGVDDDRNGLVDDIRGWDFVQSLGPDAWPGEDATVQDNDPVDFNGHGTHVAGIAGARTDNGVGVAGVGFRCKILPLRIGGSIRDRNGEEQGVVFMSYAAAAIVHASQEGVAAINCSWGSSLVSALAVAVDLAVVRGVILVVAAGNDNQQIPSYLGARGDCLDVAATTRNDTKASFSSFGVWVDVAAPGVEILSTYFDHTTGQHGYRTLQGTSMAAPIVTGMVGLVKAGRPGFSASQIRAAILAGADDLHASDPAFAGLLGAGRVNVLKSFGDRFLQVPGEYPTPEKAMAASSVGDTVAILGDTLITAPLYITQSGRRLMGSWQRGFTRRDLTRPTVITSRGVGPALEFVAGVDSTLVVDGFRFTGGAARFLAAPNGYFGGGVLCSGASPQLRDCEFDGNGAGSDQEFGGGGGAFFANSSAKLLRCRFHENHATRGAGLYAYDVTLQLEDCRIEDNALHQSSEARGGGVFLEAGSVQVRGGHVSHNGLAQDGGGLFVRAAKVVLEGTRIESNLAVTGGGIALLEGAVLVMRGCVVRGNRATHLGGGIYALGASGDVQNGTFYENRGAGSCLFVQNATSPWSLRNALVVGHENVALFFFSSPADLDYNLYWNNPGGDVQGAATGAHALREEPRFVDAAAGDFALGQHSPALDSGDPLIPDADGSRSDRGAFGGTSGRSRAPAPPRLHAARAMDAATSVAWSASPEPDVRHYALYRGADSTFVASQSSWIAVVEVDRTAYADAEGRPGHWYRLAAVDSSGASSGFSAAVPAVRTDLDLPRAEALEPRGGLPAQPAAPAPAPALLALHPGWPNPANPSTRIRFDLPSETAVHLEVFDVRGRMVRRLVHGVRRAGGHAVDWDGRDEEGRDLPSGIYVVRLRASGASSVGKLTLLR